MPPRRSKRQAEQAATTSDNDTVDPPPKKRAKGKVEAGNAESVQAEITEVRAAPGPHITGIPPELFTEILTYFSAFPLTYHAPTQRIAYDNRYREREDALRVLSQSCRALRTITLPLLWERLHMCWVPERAVGTWYKYVMLELQRKAEGMRKTTSLHPYIKIISFRITKSSLELALPSLTALLALPSLTGLHTIQVIDCNNTGPLASALSTITLPHVRTVIAHNFANSALRACPNATSITCIGGTGKEVVGALKNCAQCTTFRGYVDWTPKLMQRLPKCAPHLQDIEIRRPINNGLGIDSQNEAPAEWATAIPALAGLKDLTTITLTFPGAPIPTDDASIAAARAVLRGIREKRGAGGEKLQLCVRRIFAPHYTNEYQEDEVANASVQIF